MSTFTKSEILFEDQLLEVKGGDKVVTVDIDGF